MIRILLIPAVIFGLVLLTLLAPFIYFYVWLADTLLPSAEG